MPDDIQHPRSSDGPDADRPVADRLARETPSDRDTGAALRSIYQNTIAERIPDEMLDLLGKLD